MQSPCKRPASSNSYRVLNSLDTTRTQKKHKSPASPRARRQSCQGRSYDIWQKKCYKLFRKSHKSRRFTYTHGSQLQRVAWGLIEICPVSCLPCGETFPISGTLWPTRWKSCQEDVDKFSKDSPKETLLAKKESLHHVNCVLDVEFTFWYTSLKSEMKMVQDFPDSPFTSPTTYTCTIPVHDYILLWLRLHVQWPGCAAQRWYCLPKP